MTVQENLEIGSYVPKAKAERRRRPRSGLQHLSAAGRSQDATGGHHERRRTADGGGRARVDVKAAAIDARRAFAGLGSGHDRRDLREDRRNPQDGHRDLLVEQNVSRALSLVQRAYVLESGSVIMHGTSAELADNKQVQAAYLGIYADQPFCCSRKFSNSNFKQAHKDAGPRSRGAMRPGLASKIRPMRAWGMPGARRTRSLVCAWWW